MVLVYFVVIFVVVGSPVILVTLSFVSSQRSKMEFYIQ